MKYFGVILWNVIVLALLVWVGWQLELGDVIRTTIVSGHLLDWIMGGFCLIWLLIILKVPWDLYFQAQGVAFEIQRSKERGIAIVPGREEYVRLVRSRLGWLAVGTHVASAALIAAITYFTGGAVGYFFAGFYLLSTLFRPAAAGYAYLSGKLRDIAQEARYPREDIAKMRSRVEGHDKSLHSMAEQIQQLEEALSRERTERETETSELRQSIHAIGREFETTVSKLTDNQEIIRGIQAFVRLVAHSANS
jgi:Skp family chaperone for outer membrane proteins